MPISIFRDDAYCVTFVPSDNHAGYRIIPSITESGVGSNVCIQVGSSCEDNGSVGQLLYDPLYQLPELVPDNRGKNSFNRLHLRSSQEGSDVVFLASQSWGKNPFPLLLKVIPHMKQEKPVAKGQIHTEGCFVVLEGKHRGHMEALVLITDEDQYLACLTSAGREISLRVIKQQGRLRLIEWKKNKLLYTTP